MESNNPVVGDLKRLQPLVEVFDPIQDGQHDPIEAQLGDLI
jgi:hypothetical protein